MDGSQDEIAAGTDEEPRRRTGCLVGGLRVTFWAVIGLTIYMVATLVLAYALSPISQNWPYDWPILVAVPMMFVGPVAAVLLARRFRNIPVLLMASVVLAAVASIVILFGYQLATGRDRITAERDAEFERSLSGVTEVLGEPVSGPDDHRWHDYFYESGHCEKRREALWRTGGDTALTESAVNRVEQVVRDVTGRPVFPTMEEAQSDGDLPRTYVGGFDGRMYLHVGDWDDDPDTFILLVVDWRRSC